MFTIIGIHNDSGLIYFKHFLAFDADAAAGMAAEDADIKFVAILPGWHDSLLNTEGLPREASDMLDTDDQE